MNLPNKLTMARIIAVPFFVYTYLQNWLLAATVIFILAAVTDAFDGYIARSRGLVTNFGKIMDPLADKILVLAAFTVMVQEGQVAGWMLIVIFAREFLVSGLRIVAAADGLVIAAGLTGKLKTVLQMLAVPLLLLDNWPMRAFPATENFPLDRIVLWACVIMTIISGVEYIYKNKEIFLKGGI